MAELQIVQADGAAEGELLRAMRARAAGERDAIAQAAQKMLADVRAYGFEAVEGYARRFDGAPVREIAQDALRAAYDRLDDALRGALTRAAENIRDYHTRMKQSSWEWDRGDGRVVGQLVRPLARVGLYVPGGTAAYPSTVLMNAIPAKAAGVPELVMATPPGKNLSDAVLAAAYIAGVDRVFTVGGVQAVGALAYGAGMIPRVDKIIGPGNAYVAAAKRLVFGDVDIDMIAGPSEVLVIADDTADPVCAAADLLSQAEHDVLASAILLTDSEAFARETAREVKKQLAALPRREIAAQSIENYGAAIVCRDLDEAALLADEIAPEHLEIMTENPRALLPLIHNAGAVFLGAYSPEPLGDYMAGPSHVLPTSGSARFFSPLGADSFVKKMSLIEYSAGAFAAERDDIVTLARAEGLDAHAAAALARGTDAPRRDV